ncbi:hypothetical protein ACGFW5_02940 [Streptomyces sp. NPDC048416]|uniref:hypothetical protein n=1 Tax=Streptomyces sp. NPDC048416 TaxID=3365546 RepID=UPI00371922B4
MADERHEWLDGDAAERLLRGDGIEPGDERARAEAAELAALLRSLAATEPAAGLATGPATTELPGEAAALAAFRAARAETAAAGEALGVVRVGRVADVPAAPRRRRFAPVRLGLAAALACCALGGVAVAAGTGVLPGPFASDQEDPTPASTVSADMTPGPVVTSPSQSLPPGSPTPGRSEPSADATPSGGDPSRPAASGGPTAGTGTGPGANDGTRQGGPSGGTEGAGSAQWFAKTADDCRDYRAGRLDQDKRRSLESAAHGPAAVKTFCDLLLDGKGGSGGAGGKGGKPGGSDGGGAGGGAGKGKGDGAGNKTGGGGKPNSVTRPDRILDWLRPGASSTPATS